MKKSILLNSAVFLLCITTVFGQGGNPGNGSISGNFLGWDGTGFAQPLEIRNDFIEPINFFTNTFERALYYGWSTIFSNHTNCYRCRIYVLFCA